MMKKLTLLGMIAAVAIVGLSVTGCGGSSSSYMAMGFEITSENFNAAIAASTAPDDTTTEDLINLSRAVGESAFDQLENRGVANTFDWGYNLSVSDMRAWLQAQDVPQADINLLINRLSSQGFVLGGMPLPNGRIGIVGASRE